LPHNEALAQFRWADVFAFTSLRDTSGTVVLEALAAGTPIICLDHQGVGAIVTSDCGIKIPVTTRRGVERGLADAIVRLQSDRGHCRVLADGAYRRASEYLWTLQARRIAEEYNRILERTGSGARCELKEPADFVEHIWQDGPTEESTVRV
jgi:glycosyltransferase involved in cell wall biosynthesis